MLSLVFSVDAEPFLVLALVAMTMKWLDSRKKS